MFCFQGLSDRDDGIIFLEAKLFGGLVMTGQCHMFVLNIKQPSIQPLI